MAQPRGGRRSEGVTREQPADWAGYGGNTSAQPIGGKLESGNN
jgi:hypothetical protein